MPEIAIESLVHVYAGGVRALDGVDLRIGAGERVALIGRNGSGKSTLVRHLNGLLRPSEGRVRIDGRDTARLRVAQLAHVVGIVFQDPDRQIFAGSVADEAAFGPRNLGRSPAEVRDAVTDALRATGLDGMESRNPYELGQSRRRLLALASVLAMRTPVLVLDEPTTGQDARATERVRRIVGEVTAQGRTVIAVTHDMELVAECFERVVMLRDGRVLFDGAPSRAFADEMSDELHSTNLEAPLTARVGISLGLGPTLSADALVARLHEAQ